MIEPSSTLTYNGKPIAVLESLIQKRKEILGEGYKDAVIATAITVMKSLRADTKIAPKTARPESYTVTDTGWYGGWERNGNKFHRVVRTSMAPHSPKVAGIFPVNNAGQHYEKGEIVKVYKITPVNNSTMPWKFTKHKGCWYVFAKTEKVAHEFAKRHMTKRIDTFRGLAKATIGFAMAAISTKSSPPNEVKTAKSKMAALQAARVMKSNQGDLFSVTFVDMLNYSAKALKSGKDAVQRALMKAANSIAGRLSKVAGAKLEEPIQTPFPEVKG